MTTPKNSRPINLRLFVIAALAGALAAIIPALLLGLSPLAAADRPALALVAVCLSLPAGAAIGARCGADIPLATATDSLRAAFIAGILLATGATLGEPELMLRTAIWCVAGCLLGAALSGLAPGAGIAVTLVWLGLCALPFVCGYGGSLRPALQDWALQGTPWLGFAQDAFGGDPLRRPVLYLGQWSTIADQPAVGLLQPTTLWFAAILAGAAALVRR